MTATDDGGWFLQEGKPPNIDIRDRMRAFFNPSLMIDTRGASRMNAVLPSIISEFETAEQEASYTAWLRTKVTSSLADQRPSIPHDEVMAEMDAIIAEAETSAQRKF